MMTERTMRDGLAPIRFLAAVLLPVFFAACGSSEGVQILTADSRFELGKTKFEKGDYIDALSDFNVIKLQFPGSSVADDAQYYIGECHYHQEEFLIASEEYQTLKRSMPASPLVPMAQYKTAMCFYSLAPKSSLDQTYTSRAIDEFQAFIEYYPAHELVHDAESKIVELNNRLSKKLYDTGILYLKMEFYKAAAIYFSSVIEKYHDTEFAEPSYIGKARALNARKKYEETKQELEKFFQRYPQSPLKDDAISLQQEADSHMKSTSAAQKK